MKALAMLGLLAVLDRDAVARLLKLPLAERPREPARLSVELRGTMVAHDRRFSYALLGGRSVFVGDEVEGRVVRDVTRDCVLFDAEELCIHKRERKEHDVARHVALASFVQPQLRVVPVPNGFKLFSIPKGSIYEDLGIQNGDILRTVNGKPAGLDVLPLVKPGAVLRVELERNGQLYALEGQLD